MNLIPECADVPTALAAFGLVAGLHRQMAALHHAAGAITAEITERVMAQQHVSVLDEAAPVQPVSAVVAASLVALRKVTVAQADMEAAHAAMARQLQALADAAELARSGEG